MSTDHEKAMRRLDLLGIAIKVWAVLMVVGVVAIPVYHIFKD